MMFTEEEVKDGYAEYCEAKFFNDQMDEALKEDGIKLSKAPKDVQKKYQQNLEIIRKYEAES